MRSLILIVTLISTPILAKKPLELGAETEIAFAGGGTLRDWTTDPKRSGIVFVRDSKLQWYQIKLSGDCPLDPTLDTFVYTVDNDGTFDRFSRIGAPRFPNRSCNVLSIRTSLAPASRTPSPS